MHGLGEIEKLFPRPKRHPRPDDEQEDDRQIVAVPKGGRAMRERGEYPRNQRDDRRKQGPRHEEEEEEADREKHAAVYRSGKREVCGTDNPVCPMPRSDRQDCLSHTLARPALRTRRTCTSTARSCR